MGRKSKTLGIALASLATFWAAYVVTGQMQQMHAAMQTAKQAMEPRLSMPAQFLSPVIPVSGEVRAASFLAAAARDPEALRHKPEDEQDATRLAQEIKELRADLQRSPGERALELNEQAYQRYASLSYYLEDVATGRIQTSMPAAQAAHNLEAVRRFLIQHASAYAKASKDESRRATAYYHAHAAQYFLGQNRAASIKNLAALQAMRLSPALKTRARIIVALDEMDSGRGVEAAKTLAALARSLPADAATGVRLAAARGFAGLNAAGKRVRAPNAAYRAQLMAASLSASALPAVQKDEALRNIVGIWRAAEANDPASWSKVPFKMAAFKESVAVKGIVERAALADWRAGNKAQALRKYASISAGLAGAPVKADVDLRMLDLLRLEYAQSKSPKAYESALTNAGKVYVDTGILGQGQEARAKAVSAEIARRYESLVYDEMKRVAGKSATKQERLRAIAMAGRFLPTIDDDKRIEDMRARVAGLYAMNEQYREAVAIYKELAETGVAGDKRKYYALAIASQRVLARWPGEAPWRQIPPGPGAEREELHTLYKKYGEVSGKKSDWALFAQVGLLDLALGRAEQAFGSWRDALKADARGPHAAQAAGYMLTAYERGKAWDDLEAVSRLVLKAQLTPSYQGKTLVAMDYLGLALIEGGKEAMAANDFKKAVAKLKEFVAQHGASKRHDEGMFCLAHAYRGSGEHKASIETLLAFVERHPTSKYLRDALLSGGDWSGPLTYEENAMFFYSRFIQKYPRDGETPRVRDTLTTLYLGRSLYAEALDLLRMKAADTRTAADDKTEALVQAMDLEERQGSAVRAHKAAGNIIASGTSTDAKAVAYALQARLAAKKGDYATVQQVEAKIAALGASEAQQEALGEARYYLADARSSSVVKKYFNLALKDPTATLQQRFGAYQQARASYVRVCEGGQSSYCAPAMHKLARLSDEFLQSLEDIEVQDTLAKEVVARFKSYKQSVLNEVAKSSQGADAEAVTNVAQGNSDPDSAQEVMWQNTSDWTFDRVAGETGNGFVQWSAAPAE